MPSPLAPQPIDKLAGSLRHRFLLAIEPLKVMDKVMLGKALSLAEEVHKQQTRRPSRSNPSKAAPFIVHPLRVSLIIVEELELKEPIALAAALLHDVVEMSQGKVTIGQIEESFGRPIAMMVSILTMPPGTANLASTERDQKLKIYQERIQHASVETKLVKLADRLDNTREAQDLLDKGFQQKFLDEGRSFYLPLAENTDNYLCEELALALDALEKAIKFG
ncbi:MAG: bifunctional (p)ppGpp synthetase/guanosine-3',5'-bis(diphosphate) 3'-pyrophosphohydrolase [Candidatus Obscuribacter sp.]|jgi:(p)ppGpp synthase/HD superfamily hydrolase|nr:bifunctional (p)ppGpp synthetase/guanosine-3',5'-bis(diphosphate) 3'-pyrophosphohydrolase [Candidatus Obscuribacter sp.]MBK9204313.1 bifunctional (p)ppGpp synthetase/guanosine-3',5'-bis(diphosphate) 3'-pyrophosphohydrolase [Candidatus Obscuribacter sp.]MBL0186478.1 bifunctional (p)ppGpp synthetase/guanosine-3',5'-bis(diphosphate) 3'-pyrophosphohydrolase [Candidatus Obscuribacter sp.]